MKQMTTGVYNRNKNMIMVAQQLIEVMYMTKILTVLAAVTVGLLVYLVWLLRKEPPTEIVLAPMNIDFEDGTEIRIEPVDIEQGYEFRNTDYWNPDRLN